MVNTVRSALPNCATLDTNALRMFCAVTSGGDAVQWHKAEQLSTLSRENPSKTLGMPKSGHVSFPALQPNSLTMVHRHPVGPLAVRFVSLAVPKGYSLTSNIICPG